jgi:hypothetical protein
MRKKKDKFKLDRGHLKEEMMSIFLCPAVGSTCEYGDYPQKEGGCNKCPKLVIQADKILNITEIKEGIILYEHYRQGDILPYLAVKKMVDANRPLE